MHYRCWYLWGRRGWGNHPSSELNDSHVDQVLAMATSSAYSMTDNAIASS